MDSSPLKRPPLRATQAAAAASKKKAGGANAPRRARPPPPPPAAASPDGAAADDGDAYERAREANIARNRAAIEALRLRDLAAGVEAAGVPKPRQAAAAAAAGKQRRAVRASTTNGKRRAPTRASARTRGLGPEADVPLVPYEPPPEQKRAPRHRSSVAVAAKPPRAAAARAAADGTWLYSADEFWAAVPGGNPCPDPIVSDGVFRGGLEPGVAARLARLRPGDLARGGGFTSAARAAAAASIHSNPNAYFYRFPEPGVPQRNGPWEPHEATRFLEVARTWGVGSAWGLFASHIPGRVGYQAAAFYRDIAIPSGAVLDPRFAMSVDGRAVWVGE